MSPVHRAAAFPRTGAPAAAGRSNQQRQTIMTPKRDTLTAKRDTLTAVRDSEAGDERQPKNLPANAMPTEGYGLEVDGKMKSYYATQETAMARGLALKQKFPLIQVKIYGAKDQTRTTLELPSA
jgi:hypothetical protein